MPPERDTRIDRICSRLGSGLVLLFLIGFHLTGMFIKDDTVGVIVFVVWAITCTHVGLSIMKYHHRYYLSEHREQMWEAE